MESTKTNVFFPLPPLNGPKVAPDGFPREEEEEVMIFLYFAPSPTCVNHLRRQGFTFGFWEFGKKQCGNRQ